MIVGVDRCRGINIFDGNVVSILRLYVILCKQRSGTVDYNVVVHSVVGGASVKVIAAIVGVLSVLHKRIIIVDDIETSVTGKSAVRACHIDCCTVAAKLHKVADPVIGDLSVTEVDFFTGLIIDVAPTPSAEDPGVTASANGVMQNL